MNSVGIAKPHKVARPGTEVLPGLRISTAGHNSTKGRRKKAPLPGDVSARASHVPHSHKRFPSKHANGAVSTATHLEPAPIRHGPWPSSGAPTSRLPTSIKGRRKGGGDKSKARRIAVGKWCDMEAPHAAHGPGVCRRCPPGCAGKCTARRTAPTPRPGNGSTAPLRHREEEEGEKRKVTPPSWGGLS